MLRTGISDRENYESWLLTTLKSLQRTLFDVLPTPQNFSQAVVMAPNLTTLLCIT